MRKVTVLAGAMLLAACGRGGVDANDVVVNGVVVDAEDAAALEADLANINRPEPLPPYVPAPNDAEGENAISSAIPGESFFRDLPSARLLRGDWRVRKSAWFPVGGGGTQARSPARMRAFDGAHVRIDRQRILVTPRDPKLLAEVTLDCSGVGYLDKERLFAAENALRVTSREDVMVAAEIGVAEREISRAFAKSQSVEGQVLALHCPLSDFGDAEEGVYPVAYLTGALLMDRNHMVLIFSDGTTLYAERDGQ